MPARKKSIPKAPSPFHNPLHKFGVHLKRRLTLSNCMVITVGTFMIFTFLNTLITNPTIVGYSVFDSSSQDTGRMSGMLSLLLMIFSFFFMFMFIVVKKSKMPALKWQ